MPRSRKSSCNRSREAYRQKEITFPVEVAMASHMAERTSTPGGGQQKYDREGLYRWARLRFAQHDGKTLSRTGFPHRIALAAKEMSARSQQAGLSRDRIRTPSTTRSKKPFPAHRQAEAEDAKRTLRMDEARRTRSNSIPETLDRSKQGRGPADALERLRPEVSARNAQHGARPVAGQSRFHRGRTTC